MVRLLVKGTNYGSVKEKAEFRMQNIAATGLGASCVSSARDGLFNSFHGHHKHREETKKAILKLPSFAEQSMSRVPSSTRNPFKRLRPLHSRHQNARGDGKNKNSLKIVTAGLAMDCRVGLR